MRTPARVMLISLALLAGSLHAEDVVWNVSRGRKTKVVYEGELKKFNWAWPRQDPGTISSYSQQEKRWMLAIFPGAEFRLLREEGNEIPDEFLVLPDRRVISKDDFFPVQAGADGSSALSFVIRAPDGLVAVDGTAMSLGGAARQPEPEPTPEPSADLDAYLYMDDPPPPPPEPVAPVEPVVPEPAPAPARLDRFAVPGEVRFYVVKDTPTGATKVLYHARSTGPMKGIDLLRFRAFPFGKGKAFGLVYRWNGEGEGAFTVGYKLFARGPWGIEESWSTEIVKYTADEFSREAVRFHFRDVDPEEGAAQEPELLLQKVNLASLGTVPDWERFAPRPGGAASSGTDTGVVRILQFRNGVFKMVGWADQARGDRPVALRKNWPNYSARRSPGPSMLLSFGTPGSPLEAYPCPWPDHPPRKVPWVGKEYLFKGAELLRGEGDLGLAVWALHDAQALYVIAVVKDDKLVLPAIDRDPADGDHLQLWLDPRYGEDSLMLELFPGSPPGAGAQARIRSPSSRVGPAPRVRVAARSFEQGYWLEAAIPFSFLEDLELRPEGSLWGFVVNAVDVDDAARSDQKAVLSTSKDFKWARTDSFNNLILE